MLEPGTLNVRSESDGQVVGDQKATRGRCLSLRCLSLVRKSTADAVDGADTSRLNGGGEAFVRST